MIPVGIYLAYDRSSKEPSSTKKTLVVNTSKVAQYKTVFKTKEVESKMDIITNTNNIQNINKDANTLIAEADSFIKTHNLTLPTQTLSNKEQLKIQKRNEKLKAMQLELEELSNES